MKQSVEKKEEDIKQSIETAESLVENKKVDKKDESAQQLQKLKSSTADLRVRLDSVSTDYCKTLYFVILNFHVMLILQYLVTK